MYQFISNAVGTQRIGNFADCQCDITLLDNAITLPAASAPIFELSGLQIMARVFHQFQPIGASGLF